jgi:hypothetical protein
MMITDFSLAFNIMYCLNWQHLTVTTMMHWVVFSAFKEHRPYWVGTAEIRIASSGESKIVLMFLVSGRLTI